MPFDHGPQWGGSPRSHRAESVVAENECILMKTSSPPLLVVAESVLRLTVNHSRGHRIVAAVANQ